MSGEISNLYGMNLYNNPYSNNNDDFLAQQYFAQQAGQIQGQTQNQPAFQGYQQPQTDTFQKSGSGLTTGLTLGTIAGAGTGAGIYYLGTNPIKDGKFNENFLGALDEANYQDVLKNKKAELLTNAKKPILAKYKISVDTITTSEVSVALTLDTTGSTSTGDTLLTQSLLMELSALLIVSSTRADALPSGEKPTFTDGVSIIANDGVVNSNGHASSDTRSRVTIVFLPDIKTPEFNRGQSSLVVIPYGGDTTMDDRRRWPLSEC